MFSKTVAACGTKAKRQLLPRGHQTQLVIEAACGWLAKAFLKAMATQPASENMLVSSVCLLPRISSPSRLNIYFYHTVTRKTLLLLKWVINRVNSTFLDAEWWKRPWLQNQKTRVWALVLTLSRDVTLNKTKPYEVSTEPFMKSGQEILSSMQVSDSEWNKAESTL